MAPSVVVLAAGMPAVVAPSVVVLAAVALAVVAQSVVMLAVVVPAVVAPSVVVLAAVVPAASGRCPVPPSDVAPQRLAQVTEGPAQGRGLAGVELELAGMAAGRVASGNAIGCSSSPLVASLACRCPVVAAQLSRGPAAMRRDAPRSPRWHCCVG